MNIALYHNLPSGGARRAMVEMVKGLVARGHTVDEYCPDTADLSFLSLDGIVRRSEVTPIRLRGVARKRVPLLTPYLTAARLRSDLQTMVALSREVAQHINQQHYDVTFTHDCQLVLVPDILRFLQGPHVHYFHAGTGASAIMDEGNLSDSGFLQRIKRFYYAPARRAFPQQRFRQARRNLQAAQNVLTNSHFAAAELRKDFDIVAQVCTLGVDVAIFRPLKLPRKPFVFSVGAIHYFKGYRFLFQALAKLPEGQRPPLVIAANSVAQAELRALQALATELGVNFTVLNVADEAEMVGLYNHAAAFVYAPIREPWGLAAVEAMACGAPVVAVGEGGVVESVVDGETGLLTRRDPEAFAAALGRVLTDSKLAARLGAGGVTRARTHFTWERTVDQLEMHLRKATQMEIRPWP